MGLRGAGWGEIVKICCYCPTIRNILIVTSEGQTASEARHVGGLRAMSFVSNVRAEDK